MKTVSDPQLLASFQITLAKKQHNPYGRLPEWLIFKPHQVYLTIRFGIWSNQPEIE